MNPFDEMAQSIETMFQENPKLIKMMKEKEAYWKERNEREERIRNKKTTIEDGRKKKDDDYEPEIL